MRTLRHALAAAALLTASTAHARTFVLPHVLEKSGTRTASPFTFDTTIFATYTGGLRGAPPVGVGAATVEIWLYDARTSAPLQASSADVCNPCAFKLDATDRTLEVGIDALVDAAGGVVGDVAAFAVVSIGGDEGGVALRTTGFATVDGQTRAVHAREAGSGLATGRRMRVWGDPHVDESDGRWNLAAGATDTSFHFVYAGGIVPGSASSTATVYAFLYDDQGAPMRSKTGQDVCNPCVVSLSKSTRAATLDLEARFVARGGFPAARVQGSLVVTATGADPGGVAIRTFVVNSHTSPFDLSVFGFEPQPLSAPAP